MNTKIIDEMLEKTGWGFGDPGDDCMQCSIFDPYKFAELIIAECGEIADNSVDHGIPSAYIDKHFGVE